MKQIKMILLVLLCLLVSNSSLTTYNELQYAVTTITPKEIYFTKDNLDHAPEYILAAIAYHECFNISPLERRWVMEAVWNRVEDNFNNNGKTIQEQLLANKQFTGLFIYYPKQFRFDPNDPICLENLSIAIDIVQRNKRTCPQRIYYWASKKVDKHTAHWRNIISKSINIKSFSQIFA